MASCPYTAPLSRLGVSDLDITVTLRHEATEAEVVLEGVSAYAPEVIRDCFTRCGEAMLQWDVEQRVLDGRINVG